MNTTPSREGSGLRVQFKYFAMVREITGKKDESITLPKGAVAKDALRALSENYGEKFTSYTLTEKGELRGELTLLINGEAIESSALDRVELKDGDVLIIMPPVGGG